jgi:hypothetical protein
VRQRHLCDETQAEGAPHQQVGGEPQLPEGRGARRPQYHVTGTDATQANLSPNGRCLSWPAPIPGVSSRLRPQPQPRDSALPAR